MIDFKRISSSEYIYAFTTLAMTNIKCNNSDRYLLMSLLILSNGSNKNYFFSHYMYIYAHKF